MGLACHAAFGSYIATLVEIEVTRDQRLRVLRAVCAVDCGRAINPEIVKQQIEGGLIHGISAAIGRPIEIADGSPMLRHHRRLRPADLARRARGQRRAARERGGFGRSHRARRADRRARRRQRLFLADRATGARAADRRRAARMSRIGVLLINLGTPDAADARAVRRYLKEFLSDRRVVEIPALLWQPILRGIILTTRPRKSAHAYRQVWTEEGSPLAAITARQAKALAGRFGAACHRRSCDALRQSRHRRAHRRADGGGLRAHPARAALSAILRGDDRDRQRRRLRPSRLAARPAGGAHAAALS